MHLNRESSLSITPSIRTIRPRSYTIACADKLAGLSCNVIAAPACRQLTDFPQIPRANPLLNRDPSTPATDDLQWTHDSQPRRPRASARYVMTRRTNGPAYEKFMCSQCQVNSASQEPMQTPPETVEHTRPACVLPSRY